MSEPKRIPVRISRTGNRKYPLLYLKIPQELIEMWDLEVGKFVVFEIDEEKGEVRLRRL